MALPTLLDIAVRSGVDAVVGLIDEASRQVPELTGRVFFQGQMRQIPNLGAARTIRGRQFKTLVRTALPAAGYRNANNGSDAVKSTYENRLVETYILNPRWECDVAVAQSSEDGSEAYIADEGIAVTRSALMAVGKQFFYGTSALGDSAGNPGLIQSYDATNMVVDAGGTTASTGSSVWAVKFGPQFVEHVFGEEGMMEMSEVRKETILGANSKNMTAYVQELLAYPGCKVGSVYSIGRIKKLTADSGKGMTDARAGALLALFPVGFEPDVFLCSRRSLEQWRASRTATSTSGREAPTPTDYEGIPIVPTDSILNTESLTL